jgi:hypothetical protein
VFSVLGRIILGGRGIIVFPVLGRIILGGRSVAMHGMRYGNVPGPDWSNVV